MKTITVFVLIFTIIFINDVQGDLLDFDGMVKLGKTLEGPCVAESGVSIDKVHAVQKGVFEEDPKLKCYMKCVLGKFQGIKNGKVSTDDLKIQTRALIVDDLASKLIVIIDKCAPAPLAHSDPCEASFAYLNCVYHADSSIYVFP